ncbi:MAG: acyl-CoA reductase, partial [Candidatus Eiseniibacteriota bacterium]
LDLETAIDILERAAAAGRPLAVLGTAFALVHLVDALAARRRRLELPPPSRVMETGGLKGRSRAVTRSELYTALGRQLGLPRHAIVGEYGMTEMISQFYDAGLRDRIDDPESRVLVAPPWVRTSVVDRRTGEPVAPGAAGVLVHLDLGARGSAVRLETEDLGRLAGDGFVLLGRARDAAPRGCSLPYEEIERRIRGGGDRTDERSIARPVDDVTSVDHPEVHATHVHLPPSIELRIGGWDDSPERLAALAEALAAGAAAVRRRHDAAARAAALARLSDAWLAPECAARARALDVLAATSGRARAMLAMALDALFLELRRPGLDRLLASERQALAASPPRLVLHIPAGSVLPPTIVGPLASLLLGAPCIVRPPRSIAILPALWAAALTTLGEGGAASDAAGAAAADLATLIAVVPWERSRTDLTRTALRAAASAVLSGDDATLDAISALAPTTTRIVRHGHRIAVAAIDGRRLARRAATIAAALARDVTLYDQRGCLSPQTVLVVESAPGQAHDLARHLAAQLRRMAVRAPYDVHLVEDGEAFAGALRARELLAAMRGEHLHGGVESGWAVVVQGAGEARVESAPAGRVVFVGAVRRLEEAITLLEPLAPLLQGVGMELDVADRARLATALGTGDVLEATGAACGPIRLCRPGRLQAPPATWAADGLPPLASQLAAPPGRD